MDIVYLFILKIHIQVLFVPNMIDAPDMYTMIIEGNENLERNTVHCMVAYMYMQGDAM